MGSILLLCYGFGMLDKVYGEWMQRLSSVRDPKKKKYIYRPQDRPEGISFFVTRLSVFSRGGAQVPLEEWTWFCASALGGERCATELTGT